MKRRFLLLPAAAFLASALFHQPVEYDNTKSRLILLSSIVDQGTLSIDAQEKHTIDKSFHGGHYYSNKPPGTAFLAVPVYWSVRHFFIPLSELPDATILADPASKYIVRLWVSTFPFALLVIVLLRLLIRMGAPERSAVWAVSAYAFGTIALNHASLFSGHQTAACFLMFSLAALWELGKSLRPAMPWAFASGFFAGTAVLCEYAAFIAAAALGWYAWGRLASRGRAAFAGGAGLCALVLAAYNTACFGNPFTLSYENLSYGPFTEGTQQGLFGLGVPDPFKLVSLLFSPARGLFFIMPVLLFSVTGWRALRREHPREAALALGIPAAFFLIYSGYFGWHGGWTFGPRYLVVALPFLILPMAFAGSGGLPFLAAFGLSAFQVWLAQAGVPHAPPEISNPLVEFIVPMMIWGYTAMTPWGTGLKALLAAGAAAAGTGAALAWSLRATPVVARASPRWRWGVLAVCAAVSAGLLLSRSADPAAPGRYRALILKDGANALGSWTLAAASFAETALSNYFIRPTPP